MTSSKLNVVRGGPTEGSAVILIHAVGLDLTYWDCQIEALTAHHQARYSRKGADEFSGKFRRPKTSSAQWPNIREEG